MAIVMTSCSLDPENKADIDADSYLKDPEGVAALRVYMYTTMKPLVNETNLTEWGTDLYTVTQTATVNDYQSYRFSPEDGEVKSYYQNCYFMINQANELLKYANGNAQYEAEAKFVRTYGYYLLTQQFGAVPYVTEYIETANKNYPRTPLKEIYDSMIAELESIQNSTALPASDNKGNVSQRAVKALLAKVCLAAGWDLETTLQDAAKGTYTVTGKSYFEKAAKAAEATINGQQLTMSFEDKWSPFNEGNEEEIFAVQYERKGYPGDINEGGHQRQATYGAQLGDPTNEGLKNSSGSLATSYRALYLWDEGDDRYDGTFMTTIYNYTPGEWGTTGYYAYYNATPDALKNMRVADKFFPWWTTEAEVEAYIDSHQAQCARTGSIARPQVLLLQYPKATIWTFNEDGTRKDKQVQDFEYFKRTNAPGLCVVKKFDDAETQQVKGGNICYRDIVVLHLSDIYLVAAEAELMAGNESRALQYINAVRERSHASHLNSLADYKPKYVIQPVFGSVTMLDLVLDERARELYAETSRWMDLRRTRQLVRYCVAYGEGISSPSDMANAHGEIKWLRPIPASEIATNTGISEADQNPGY